MRVIVRVHAAATAMERATALRGRRNLDSAFLTGLLDAGRSADREVKFMVSEPDLHGLAGQAVEAARLGGLRMVGPDIDLDSPADMEGAMLFLTHVLVGALEEEMAALGEGWRNLPFSRRTAEPGPSVR